MVDNTAEKGSDGSRRGGRLQIIRARLFWFLGDRAWMSGTVDAQRRMKRENVGGQLSRDIFGPLGNGTDGGSVVQERAAK
jgi:hypothetical protein